MSISKKVKESQVVEKPSENERILLKEYQVGITKFSLFLNPNGYLRINQEREDEYRGGITIAPKTLLTINTDVKFFTLNKEKYGREDAIKILQTDYAYYEELQNKEKR